MSLSIETSAPGPCTIKVYGPDDGWALRKAEEGERLNLLVWDFMYNFLNRKVHKDEHEYKTANEALEAVWEYMWTALRDAGVNLDDDDC